MNTEKANNKLSPSNPFEDAKVLSRIGQKIIACLSVDEIISTVYEEVNTVMVASSMNLGIFNKEKNRLEFPGTTEWGERLEFHWATLDETHKLPVVCYTKELDIFINDLQKEAKEYTGHDPINLSDDGDIPDALIYTPLYAKDKLLGVISVQSFDKNTYTEYHLDLLKNIGNYIGIAIENAQLYEKMEREIETRTSELRQQKETLEKTYSSFTTLSEIGKDITSSLSVEEIIEKTYDNVNKLMDAAAFAIGVYNKSHNHLVFKGAIENGKKLPNAIDNLQEDSYAAICFNKGEKVIINSLSDIKEYVEEEVSSTAGDETASLIYLPLNNGANSIGVITVQSFNENAYGDYELNILETLANYTAIALENATAFESIAALSEIGKEVSSSLDLSAVLSYLYKKVNQMMDAPIFVASSYSSETKVQTYELCMENGKEVLQGHKSELKSERASIAAWVVHNKKEVIINDIYSEYETYIDDVIAPHGDVSQSIIYIPLIVEKNVIGILSVQSLEKNAYNKHHVELIRSLASYVSGAFNNAMVYKEIEAARKEMEELSIVARETDNAVIIMDKDGTFEWVNKAYEQMSGYNIDGLREKIGNSIKNIEDTKLQKKLAVVYKTKKSVSFESSFLTKEEKKIWVQTNISPVLDENNEIVKLVALDSNITERKQSELKIREKNKDITDSINYASRIQRAMLPKNDFIDHLLPKSFILYKPRDIVSGDFYWMTKTPDNDILVATVDCTGHGVPGAFLTIVGNNLLDQIVNSNGITNPGEVLTHMNIMMLKQFEGTTQGGMKDGMDMSLCKISQHGNQIDVHFAGAYNSLIHVRDNNLTEIKANRFSIGTPLSSEPKYDTHRVDCIPGDTIYMASDGYQDQIGGEKGKKFKKTKFLELIKEHNNYSISEQKELYNDVIETWKGKYPQLDDILLMGIRF